MKYVIRVVFASILLLNSAVLIAAPDSYRIDLPSQSFTPPEDVDSWFNELDSETPVSALVQFYNHPTRQQRQQLSNNGVHLQWYIDGGAWAAYVEPGVNKSVFTSTQLRWIGNLEADDKLTDRVAELETPSWAHTEDGRTILAVRFMRPVPKLECELILTDLGFESGDFIEIMNTFYVAGSPENINRLAELPEVLLITFPAPPMSTVNGDARIVTGAENASNPPYGLSGEGVTICVYDGGMVDSSHPDFEGRVSDGAGENGDVHDHPTHVAGSVGGNGDPMYRGMAPACEIVSYEYEACSPYCLYDSPQDMYENYRDSRDLYDAEIATNSIGANIYINYPEHCDWQGDYELTSSLLDSIVQNGYFDENYIIVFAAGNERGDGPCGLFYESMSVPGGAKNIITVGATDDNDQMTNFSSWGPVDDGRVKPDICAPGYLIQSTLPFNGHGEMSGTSMATPIVSGNIVLFLEAWHDIVSPETPEASTVKAILCNEAEDLGNEGPDYQYGFGRIDIVNSIESILQFRFIEGSIEDNNAWTRDFEVAEDQDILSLTLAWSDQYAAPYSHLDALVNDLDLTLTSPDGDVYYPYLLDPGNPSLPALTGVNPRDNVEKIVVDNPEAGTWSLAVFGTDVPDGPQPFSIAGSISLQDGVNYLSGIVTDSDSGEGVAQAIISVDNGQRTTFTDNTGFYSFYILGDDAVSLSCQKDGYITQNAWIDSWNEGVIVRDFSLNPEAQTTVQGTVTTDENVPAVGTTISVADLEGVEATADADGHYELNLPVNHTYRLNANLATLSGYGEIHVNPDEDNILDIVISLPEGLVSGPESYGYIAVESSDNHELAPEYNWIEIDPDQGGPGTRVTITSEEDPHVIDLQFDFKYFGVSYDQITVNENGFFCMGDVTDLGDDVAADFSNTAIPGNDGPPAMIAPFWEDFKWDMTNLSYYYDQTEGLFIVEWYDSRQFSPVTAFETFQVILYDPAVHPTPSGDGDILFQYEQVSDLGNATIGIESHQPTVGLGLMYFNNDGEGGYDENMTEVTEGDAILFVRSGATVSGVITLMPENVATEGVTVSADNVSVTTDEDGAFTIGGVFPGIADIRISYDGYEDLVVPVEVGEGSIVSDVAIELWQLLPPVNLDGNVAMNNTYHLTWDSPFEQTELNSFSDKYRVYRDGSMIAEVEDTEYIDNLDLVVEGDYWVTAVYSCVESDTSLHHNITDAITDKNSVLPQNFNVSEAWPNPFNPSTSLRISLPEAANLKVVVYDLLGREVQQLVNNKNYQAGYHTLNWNASQYASGFYFVRVEAGEHQAVRKLLLIK